MNSILPKKRYILRTPPTVTVGGTVTAAAGTWVSQGSWNGASNVFPTIGRLGDTVKEGYTWDNTSNTTTLFGPDGGIIPAGVFIRAKMDSPGQTLSNWKINYG